VFAWSAWAQPATVEAGTKVDGVGLASVRLVVVGSASHCGTMTTGEGTALDSVRLVDMG
jgi:hypothetical protein